MKSQHDLTVIAKGGSIVFIGIVLEKILRLPIGITLARSLGPDQLGIYQLAASTMIILATISLLGFPTSLVRYIPIYLSKNDESGLMGLSRISTFLPLIISSFLGAGLFYSAPRVSIALYKNPELIPSLKLASLIIPVWTITSILEGVMQGYQRMHYFVIAKKICLPAVRLLAIFSLALLAVLTSETALYAFGISTLFAAALLYYWAKKLNYFQRRKVKARYDVKKLQRFAFPIYLANLLFFLGPNIKLLLIGLLSSSADVGIFSAVYEISLVASLAYVPLRMVAAPIIAKLHGEKRKNDLEILYKFLSKWLLIINLPVFIFLFIWSEPLLNIFGKDFQSGKIALQIVAIAGIVNVSTGLTPPFITMTGKARLHFVNTFLLYLIMFILDWLLIPYWGLLGAAIAYLVATVALNVIRLIQVHIFFAIHPFTPKHGVVIISTIVTASLTWMLPGIIRFNYPWFHALFHISLFMILYFLIIKRFTMSQDDMLIAAEFKSTIKQFFLKIFHE